MTEHIITRLVSGVCFNCPRRSDEMHVAITDLTAKVYCSECCPECRAPQGDIEPVSEKVQEELFK